MNNSVSKTAAVSPACMTLDTTQFLNHFICSLSRVWHKSLSCNVSQ